MYYVQNTVRGDYFVDVEGSIMSLWVPEIAKAQSFLNLGTALFIRGECQRRHGEDCYIVVGEDGKEW